MSVNQEALQKLLMEMDNLLNKSRAELSMCNLQMERVDTNLSLIQQTRTNLQDVCDIEGDERVWKGVGKCFVKTNVKKYLKDVGEDEKTFVESKENLKKKQHYLETSLNNTINSMTQIVGKPGDK